jgi:dTDP-glucose pyrophosphorylase
LHRFCSFAGMENAKDVQLVIMAAGMSTRFGRLKQFEPLGPSGEALMTFTIRDAFALGIRKVVLIIRKEIEKEALDYIHGQMPAGMNAELAFQETLPGWTKPAGTAHALWCARKRISGPFILLNADDYYGKDALKALIASMQDEPLAFGMVPYPLAVTLSMHGAVNRGVCSFDALGNMVGIRETEGLRKNGALDPETPVSMNIWRFNSGIFDMMKPIMERFIALAEPGKEWQIPTLLMELIHHHGIKVNACGSGKEWLGVTYPEDAGAVRAALQKKSP